MIEVDGVSFSYRTGEAEAVPALQGLDLNVEPGQLVAIIGHNGPGKSTLVKLLMAVLYPTGGYTGRVNTLVLWDQEEETIVNNESREVMNMLDLEFEDFVTTATDFYPVELREEIERTLAENSTTP